MNWSWFREQVKPGMTVYDIGANRGQMALLLGTLVGPTGQVVSFEPVAEVYGDLAKNVELNALKHVQTVNAAVADIDGELTFSFDPGRPTQGQIADCEPEYNIVAAPTQVRAIRLDTFTAQASAPKLIKIDVEGGAGKVLAGARDVLQHHRPVLYIELHGPEERAAIRDFVLPAGYELRTIDGRVIVDPITDASPIQCCFPV